VPLPISASDTDVPETALPNVSATFTLTAGAIETPAATSSWAAR
jgi:hypothetical protein